MQELTLTLITDSNSSAMLILLVYGIVVAELRAREQNFSRQWPASLKWNPRPPGYWAEPAVPRAAELARAQVGTAGVMTGVGS